MTDLQDLTTSIIDALQCIAGLARKINDEDTTAETHKLLKGIDDELGGHELYLDDLLAHVRAGGRPDNY